ncbi:MAG: ABC transporter permease subunit [Paenibacillus macerans]|uniref:ABC transporter permease subunit n=1 Tax=Paenibacillus macerans TaxID=44252 RepID=A0A6N8EV67_PAEMA|nr:ABC transporter permease subunit [Paenibacillus macerans]MBS5910330.1 ABC transporter permease subunit [Paenibacillus macerans]MDU5946579.1 ABC transporter permease subunit [Paenibacillus macerans]MDU7471896.1 ABC transporter permease subunit [Paenibacillus macerans]MEC0135686.1 ABC transporter permease subunit [Paenibacillus macerans]MUG22422.1 ABC transporter permease subunit [Paenibacillus macerans]
MEAPSRKAGWGHRSLMLLLMVYLLLPLLATLIYAFAKEWQATILPESWTLEWFGEMFQDTRFLDALWKSFYLCLISVALSLAVMLPAVFIITVYLPRLESFMKGIVVLPYAVPGVVAAVGLIRAYSSGPLNISGTAYILIGAYFIVILPYMYQGIRNSLLTVSAVELLNAAEMLGASRIKAFVGVILPNIWPGVMTSTLLSFSVLFGEFVVTNMLVGGHIQTIQVYLSRRMNESGHLASAIAISYFLFILALSMVLMKLGNKVNRGISE